MRITDNMITDRTVANLASCLSSYMDIQEQMSSGKRINRPSDDPIGTQHDLSLRSRLNQIEQYTTNISQGNSLLSTYENDLSSLNDFYSSAKEVAITMSNDTYDATSREAAANEIESLLEQVLQIANNKVDGRYLYSGHKTRTEPLQASTNGVIYNGDTGAFDLEIETGTRITCNLNGQDIFFKQLSILGSDADLSVGLTADTNLADLNMGSGIDLTSGANPGHFQIYDSNRDITYDIDVSAAVTVGDLVSAVNTQLGAGGNLSIEIAEGGTALRWVPQVGTTNSITDATPLTNLNGGGGVDLQPGTFTVHNADMSVSFEVDVSDATNVGDVITAIEDALDANLGAGHGINVGYNANNTGLSITDTNGVPLGLVIENTSAADMTASDLGIVGDVGSHLEGSDLTPRADFTVTDIDTQTTAGDLGILGRINYTLTGDVIRPRLTLDSTLASLNNNSGYSLGQIKISQGDQIAIIDLDVSGMDTVADLIGAINGCGLDVTASINANETGIQIVPTVSGKTLIVENNDETNTARTLGIEGSPDMLGSLMLLTTALRNDDSELARQLNGNMDLAMNEFLGTQASLGAKINRLDATQARLSANKINATELLSEIEDADLLTLVTELSKQENQLQAAQLATSKIIQTSLLDFID